MLGIVLSVLALLQLALGETGRDSTPIEIKRSIYLSDSLYFDVDTMFPSLVSTPVFSGITADGDPSVRDLQQQKLLEANLSNFKLSEPFEEMVVQNDTANYTCSSLLAKVSPTRFAMACREGNSGPGLLRLMEIDFGGSGNKSLREVSRVLLPHPEVEYLLLEPVRGDLLFILMKKGELTDRVNEYQFLMGRIHGDEMILGQKLDFRFERPVGKMTLRLGRQKKEVVLGNDDSVLFHRLLTYDDSGIEGVHLYSILANQDYGVMAEGLYSSRQEEGSKTVEGDLQHAFLMEMVATNEGWIGVFMMDNHPDNPNLGDEEKYTFVMMDCYFEQSDEDSKLSCRHQHALGTACPQADHSTTRRRPKTDSYFDTNTEGTSGITYMYLITDCKLSRFPIKTREGGRTEVFEPKSTNISIQVREELEIGVTNISFYAIVPATYSNDSYLLIADKGSTYARILKNQKFDGEGYLYFLSTNINGYVFDALLVSVYNRRENAKQFQVYVMRRQKILITLNASNPKIYDGRYLLVRASGETLGGTIIRYDFNISVETSLENVRMQNARLPVIEVYPSSQDQFYETTFPLDYASLRSNDPKLLLLTKTQWLKLESSRFKIIDRPLFHIKGQYLNGTGREIHPEDNMIDDKYALMLYPDAMFSLFRCESTATQEFACENVIFNQTLNHTGGTYEDPSNNTIYSSCFLSVQDRYNKTHTIITTQHHWNTTVFSYYTDSHLNEYFVIYASVKSCKFVIVDTNITFIGVFAKNEEPHELPFVIRSRWEITVESFDLFRERTRSTSTEHLIYGINMNLLQATVVGFDTIGCSQITICQPIPGSEGSFYFMYADLDSPKESKTVHTATVFDEDEDFFPIEIFKTKAFLWINPRLVNGVWKKPRLELFTFDIEYQERSINIVPDDFTQREAEQGVFDIVHRSNEEGYFVLGIETAFRVIFYTFDLRASYSNPLGRLKARHFYPIAEGTTYFSVVDIDRSKIITMAFYTNGSTLAKETELGVIFSRLVIDKKRLPNIESKVQVDINSYDQPEKNILTLVVRSVEFDYSVSVKPAPVKQNITDEDITHAIEAKKKLTADIEDHLFLSTHTTSMALHYSYNDGVSDEIIDRSFMYITPEIVKTQILSSSERDIFRRITVGPKEDIRYIGNKNILLTGVQGYKILKLGEDRVNKILVEDKREGKLPIEKVITNIVPPVEFSRNRKSSPNVGFIVVVVKGDLEDLYDAELTAFNIDNPAQNCTIMIKEASNVNMIKLERTTNPNNSYTIRFQYAMKTRNGTMAYVNYFDLKPNMTKESGDPLPVYFGFTYERQDFYIEYPITLDVLDIASYNALRPSPGTACYYYFFPNSNQVGLFYLSSKALFKRYVFSSTCILKSDTKMSCKVFEQDMDIGCIVLCDQTRIESFRLRVKVDDIEGGVQDELQEVEITRGETYRLPVDYTVIDVVKGETNVDFVLAKMGDEESILFYDSTTGLIFHKMEGTEVCPVSPCLNTTYLSQLPNGRILIIPKNKTLDNIVYHRRKPQIVFSGEGLRELSTLKGYFLRVHGVGKDSYKDIQLESLFRFRKEDHTTEYIIAGAILISFLIGSCGLFLYKNYRADLEDLNTYKPPQPVTHINLNNATNMSLMDGDTTAIGPSEKNKKENSQESEKHSKIVKPTVATTKPAPLN